MVNSNPFDQALAKCHKTMARQNKRETKKSEELRQYIDMFLHHEWSCPYCRVHDQQSHDSTHSYGDILTEGQPWIRNGHVHLRAFCNVCKTTWIEMYGILPCTDPLHNPIITYMECREDGACIKWECPDCNKKFEDYQTYPIRDIVFLKIAKKKV